MSNNPFDLKNIIGFSLGGTSSTGKSWEIGKRLGGMWYKRKLEKEGYDPITAEAATEALVAWRDPNTILSQARQTYRLQEKQAQLKNTPPPVHGSARWSQPEELISKNLLNPNDGTGLSLGDVGGNPLTWNGESHLLTIAPTRTGKSTLQIVPNLLQYKGSAVVLDPKGELFTLTSKWREENVGPVYVLNPFNLEPLANLPTVLTRWMA